MKLQEGIRMAKANKSFLVSNEMGLAYFFDNDYVHCFSYINHGKSEFWERCATYDIENENAFFLREIFICDWTLHKDIYVSTKIKESRIQKKIEQQKKK